MSTISTLIIKKLEGVITPEEQMELDAYAAQSEDNKRLVENYSNREHVAEENRLSDEWRTEENWREIEKGLPPEVIRINPYLAVAAAAVLVIAISAWFWFNRKTDKRIPYAREEHQESTFHQATLTLGNGEVLNLSKVENGFLDDDRMITKSDGQLFYPANYQPKQPGMNILQTLKGSFYTLRLPDGSTVWLNSASSIQYPNGFSGDKRIVRVQGEVYFEVAKNTAMPFIVQTAHGPDVCVTGTRFTVSAYKGDSTVKTTLLEGQVKISGQGFTDSLQAGEQAIATVGRKLKKIKVMDQPEQRVQGWKANKFIWKQTDLKTILEDLSHFYGYNISYKGEIANKIYDFSLDRSASLDTIFKVLHKGTGLEFILEKKTTIAIYP